MPPYRSLLLRQRAIELMIEVYRCTSSFPNNETHQLKDRLRKAAGSVLSSIVEERERREQCPAAGIAHCALPEIEDEIHLAHQLSYLTHEQVLAILSKTGDLLRILNSVVSGIEPQRVPLQSAAATRAS